MPTDKIKELPELSKDDLFEIAAIFGVSTEAAEYRLETYNACGY